MLRLLEEIAFRNPARAQAGFAQLAGLPDNETQERIERLLAYSADPDTALAYLVTLKERQSAAFSKLVRSPASLRYLITIFSYSRFLSEEILQDPQCIEDLIDLPDLHRALLTDEYVERLEYFLDAHAVRAACPESAQLARFRRTQILRLVLRDALDFASLSEITGEISSLADAILQVSYKRLRAGLEKRYGRPRSADGSTAGFSVIALGKLGGGELNYSSDIDLMFTYSDNGETEGPASISNKEFFKKLSNQLTELLSTHSTEGVCYRVDLRLRPEGSLGEVCTSVDGAKKYYESRARDWELQMLIKARIAAGEHRPGRDLLDFVEERIYSTTLDFGAVESMSATRDRIDEQLARKRGGQGLSGFDVKLARGGIRDIEFLVQCLQRLHGGRVAWVRHGGTLPALSRLHDKNLLSPTEYWRLASAYQFLRHLEHRLQIVDDRQTHALPSDAAELEVLARRMPYGLIGAEATREELLQKLNAHLEQVIEIYERVIHAQKPMYYSFSGQSGPVPDGNQADPKAAPPTAHVQVIEPAAGNLIRSLDATSPKLAARIAAFGLKHGLRAFEHFMERAAASGWIATLEENETLTHHVLDLFEHSRYFAEQLIRDPSLMTRIPASRAAGRDYAREAAGIQDVSGLRRFYQREIAGIMTGSICLRTPIFETLGRTSDLADAVIASAYWMALNQVLASHPPATPGYRAAEQLMIIALGRLGMREFDLASDADLIFVICDDDMIEHHFWTRVAERTIEMITAYTGEGVMFAVDTRLRPNGREGPLVQSVGACKDYFARSAEAWEGIAWMKSRAVTGDTNATTAFLNQIQEVDWRRYGQSGRSKNDLKQMRMRLEKEQGAANPLKAGRGGYYDTDFVLMFLRLKGAGLFFKVLNTPERIDIIEKMGHLEREDAAFLHDAATFYRAVDHALRVYSGQAETSLQSNEAKLEALQELVRRWTPDRLNDEPLAVKLAGFQTRTRKLFDRLFA